MNKLYVELKNECKGRSSYCSIHCHQCSISQLCVPSSLNDFELYHLDSIIERRKPIQKHQVIFQAGRPLTSLYAIRTGSLKSYMLSEKGEEQITAFHLPGDIVGFDSIFSMQHFTFSQALETTMVCEIPFKILEELNNKFPTLRRKIISLMSQEIQSYQRMILLLSKMSAETRLAAFIKNLSNRYSARGFSAREFRLTMTRTDIGNYLGLTVETISRLLGRFQKMGILNVQGKYITILDMDALTKLAIISQCQSLDII